MKHPINDYPELDTDALHEHVEKIEAEFMGIIRPMNHAHHLYTEIETALKIPSISTAQVESRKQALRDHLSRYFPELWAND